MIAEPFEFAGTSHEIEAEAFDAVATTLSGAEGAAFIAALDEADDGVDVPAALVAVTLNV